MYTCVKSVGRCHRALLLPSLYPSRWRRRHQHLHRHLSLLLLLLLLLSSLSLQVRCWCQQIGDIRDILLFEAVKMRERGEGNRMGAHGRSAYAEFCM